MIIEIPDDNSIVKWKKNDNEDWKSAEISDLIMAYEESEAEDLYYQAAVEYTEYCERYEPTYNPDNGSM